MLSIINGVKYFYVYIYDGAFSIGIELERVGVIGPIRRSCTMRYLQKQQKQGDSAGERRPPLRCLSQSFLKGKEKDQLLWVRVYCIPFCGQMDRHL